MEGPRRNPTTEATLGAFEDPSRRILVPLLLYKSIFLGDWFEAVASHDPDQAVAALLRRMAAETLGEAMGLLTVMQDWERRPGSAARDEQLADRLQHHVLLELLAVKEANGEAVVMAAMQAPTDELRGALLRLAQADRRHADELRALLGSGTARTLSRAPPPGVPLGAHVGRGAHATLARAVEAAVRELTERGAVPLRLVASGEALRHLRDEGVVARDGTVAGLHVDVDFSWRGECFALTTAERVALATLLDEP